VGPVEDVTASDETLAFLCRYYACIDEGRFDDCAAFFVPDARLQVAHHPAVEGCDAIVAVLRARLRDVAWIRHEIVRAWEEDGGVVIFDVVAVYELADGRRVDVPGAVIAVVENGRFREQRIHADLSTVRG
jgi:hypothetical protein